MSILDQIKEIDPSDKSALFRRLMYQKDLAYLRPDPNAKKIIGFDVDLDKSQDLAGFTIIGIQKHTILAMKSDLDEEPRLILFPDQDKLGDPSFNLGSITAKRIEISDDSFNGQESASGTINDIANDLMPSRQGESVSDDLANGLKESVDEADQEPEQVDDKNNSQQTEAPFASENEETPIMGAEPPIDSDEMGGDFEAEPPFEEDEMGGDFEADPPFDEDEFEDGDEEDFEAEAEAGRDEPEEDTGVTLSDPRSRELNNHSNEFKKMSDLTYYAVTHYGINADLANNVATAAIQATPEEKQQIHVAVLLYIKMFEAKKI